MIMGASAIHKDDNKICNCGSYVAYYDNGAWYCRYCDRKITTRMGVNRA